MLRINLRPAPPKFMPAKTWPVVGWGLVILTICHATTLGWNWFLAFRAESTRAELAEQAQALERRLLELREGPSAESLAGSLKARNQWLLARQHTPAHLLAALERHHPPSAVITKLDLTPGSGRAKVLVPSLETVSSWSQAIGAGETQVNAEIQTPQGVLVNWTWTD